MVQNSSMDWSDVAIFLQTLRAGSARSAAVNLNVSHSTITRRIASLEKSLGVSLFRKDTSGYTLSPEGESLQRYAEQAEMSLRQAEIELKGKDAKYSGEIRITTADAIANHLLMPTIAMFSQQYPDINAEVVLSSQVLDLGDHEVDIALRIMPMNQMPPEHLVGRIIGKIAICYYATPHYLEQHDPWMSDSSAQLIGWGELGKESPIFNDSTLRHLSISCRMNHSAMQLEAAKQSMGITLLPCFIADKEPTLVRVPKCEPEIKHDIWMLSKSEQREVARLRAFKERLIDDFNSKQMKERLLGN